MELELRSINITGTGNQRITTKSPYSISSEITWTKIKKLIFIIDLNKCYNIALILYKVFIGI